jgi:hypothetical protein
MNSEIEMNDRSVEAIDNLLMRNADAIDPRASPRMALAAHSAHPSNE